ncbi:hypothetical protein QJQ45_012404 [Haematococcus lacustris]|nr:hypothetical protein QJQ45_012404 [Haematococcus lacustris]
MCRSCVNALSVDPAALSRTLNRESNACASVSTAILINHTRKSSLVNVLTTGTHQEDMIPTPRFRSLWERYCRGVQAIVYVVDASDIDSLEAARNELHSLLDKPSLKGIPLLVLGNKHDLPGALGTAAMIDKLMLKVDGIAGWARDRDGALLLNTGKAREVMARRRAAEAEAKAQAGAAEAEAPAQADVGAYEAQLHHKHADLQQREQHVADTQRLQHLQQQLQDLQQDELQHKEQQVAEQQQQLQQQQADMHLREQQLAEQQHQVQQRELQVAQQQHQVQQQQADMQQREQQVAQQQHQPMPMFQDTVKEVREDEESYALLMLFHSDLLHDEVCFGKLTNKHCERYRMHMGWKREEGRRDLRRWVLRELQSEELEAEYEADN